jgi:hypothetical protein
MSPRDLIFHNFWLKVFSIALGTIIWLAIHFIIDHDQSLRFKTSPVAAEPADP